VITPKKYQAISGIELRILGLFFSGNHWSTTVFSSILLCFTYVFYSSTGLTHSFSTDDSSSVYSKLLFRMSTNAHFVHPLETLTLSLSESNVPTYESYRQQRKRDIRTLLGTTRT